MTSKLLFLNPHDVADLSGSLSYDFGKKKTFSTKNLLFARVTFQFLVQGRAAWTVSADITAFSDRSRKYLVGPRAVLAAVAEKPFKNRLEGLNLLDAVGPSFLRIRPATGECFAPYRSIFRKDFPRASWAQSRFCWRGRKASQKSTCSSGCSSGFSTA